MKLLQLTVYAAPFRASVAAKIVWYSFNWSPKLSVTPLSETCLVAAEALPAPRPTHEADREHESRQSAQRRGGTTGRGCQQMHRVRLSVIEGRTPPGRRGGGPARRQVRRI